MRSKTSNNASPDPQSGADTASTSAAKPTAGWRRWAPLIVIAALMALVFAMGWHKYLSFKTIGLNYEALQGFITQNLAIALLIYAALYIAVVALSLPGGLIMTLAGGLLFGSTGSGAYSNNYIVAIKPGKEASLAYKLENSSKFKAPYVPCLIARDNLLFCLYDKGFASCLNAESGEILWTERTNAQLSGSPVRTRDCIYCADEKGVVWVFAASGEYKLLAQNDLGEESWSTPAIANNRLYVRTIGHLIAVGTK